MTRRAGFIDIRNIFTASGVSFRTSTLPVVTQLPPGDLWFSFPDTQEVRDALAAYQGDEGHLKSFSETYKVLRSMLYLKKGQGHGEAGE